MTPPSPTVPLSHAAGDVFIHPLRKHGARGSGTAQRGKHSVEKYDGFMSFMSYTANT